MMKLLNLFFVLCLSLITTACSNPEDEAQVRAFFENYAKLNSTFDTAIIDLYTPDAEVCLASIRGTNASQKETCMNGTRWGQLMIRGMQIAKLRNDVDTFSSITFARKFNGSYKITAQRYSSLKCNLTPYEAIIAKDSSNQWKIIEEHFVSQQLNSCKK